MNEDLRLSLANNAKEWLALSLSISSAEKVVFNTIHDGFLASHGAQFMVHVYRTTFEQALQSMPDAERNKLLYTFRESMNKAIDEHYTTEVA
jgi:lysine/ornithine N-monooxygenase